MFLEFNGKLINCKQITSIGDVQQEERGWHFYINLGGDYARSEFFDSATKAIKYLNNTKVDIEVALSRRTVFPE